MRPRIPAAAALAALLAAGCYSPGEPVAPPAPVPGIASPRLHHLLDLEDARAPLAELEPFLRDPDPEVRARAALAAARKGGEGAAGLLRLAGRDPEARVREAAAFAMGITDDPDLAGEALGMTRRPGATAAEREAAAAAAVRLGGERVWKEEGFAALFGDADFFVRRAAFRSLVSAVRGWQPKPVLGAPFTLLVMNATREDPVLVACAALALRGFPDADPTPGATTPQEWQENARLFRTGWMTALAVDTDPFVRMASALALGPLDDAGASKVWGILSRDPSPIARVGMSRALAKGKGKTAIEALRQVVEADSDFSVRSAACEALGAKKEAARDAVPALAEAAAEDPSRLVRVAAVLAMDAIGGEEATAAVKATAEAEDPFLRAAAAGDLLPLGDLARLAKDPEIRVRESAVGEAGTRGREGFAICMDALRDPDPVVAANAAGGLAEMAPKDPVPAEKGKESPREPAAVALEPAEAAQAVAAIEEVLAAQAAPVAAPDDGADLRGAALEALGKLRASTARSLATAHLGDPDPSVREAAAKVIEGLDGKLPETPLPQRLLPFVDPADLRVLDEGAPRVRFETDRGVFVVQTLPSAAPVHVARFLERVRAGGYDGTAFHRIVPAFVVQGGDPRGDGSGNGGSPTRQEFSPVPYDRGVLGVPRSQHPDSGGCQLFFCHGTTPHLDQRYTVMGRIVEGVEVLDRIDLGDRILRAALQ